MRKVGSERITAVRRHQRLCTVESKGSSLEEEDMILIDGSDGLLHPLVECQQAYVLDIRRLVQGVIPSYPGVVLVVL